MEYCVLGGKSQIFMLPRGCTQIKKCMRGKVLGSVFGKDVCETFAVWISGETVEVNWARHSLSPLAGHRGPPSLSPNGPVIPP